MIEVRTAQPPFGHSTEHAHSAIRRRCDCAKNAHRPKDNRLFKPVIVGKTIQELSR